MTKNTYNTFAKAGVVALCVLAIGASVAFGATAPQIQTNAATNIQNNSALLNGYVLNMGGDSNVTVWFQWGQTTSYGNETAHISQSTVSSMGQSIYGLANNTTYHYRAVIQNSFGTTYGADFTFVSTGGGSGTVTANAGGNQYVNPGQNIILQGSGSDSNNGSLTYSWACTGGSLSNQNIAQPTYTAPTYNGNITSYTCSLTVTSSSGGSNSSSMTVYINGGSNNSVTVQTNSASNIYSGNATLNGYLYTNGGSVTNTYAWFQWGTTTAYGFETVHQYQTVSGVLTQTITGLSSSTLYHFRAVAQSNNGALVYGQDMVFTGLGTAVYNNNYTGYTTTGYTGNGLMITSTDPNYYPTNTNDTTVIVQKNQVQGATDVPTGLTNDLLTDSFFLPLLALIVGFLLWRYRLINTTWVNKLAGFTGPVDAETKLQERIQRIRREENTK